MSRKCSSDVTTERGREQEGHCGGVAQAEKEAQSVTRREKGL